MRFGDNHVGLHDAPREENLLGGARRRLRSLHASGVTRLPTTKFRVESAGEIGIEVRVGNEVGVGSVRVRFRGGGGGGGISVDLVLNHVLDHDLVLDLVLDLVVFHLVVLVLVLGSFRFLLRRQELSKVRHAFFPLLLLSLLRLLARLQPGEGSFELGVSRESHLRAFRRLGFASRLLLRRRRRRARRRLLVHLAVFLQNRGEVFLQPRREGVHHRLARQRRRLRRELRDDGTPNGRREVRLPQRQERRLGGVQTPRREVHLEVTRRPPVVVRRDANRPHALFRAGRRTVTRDVGVGVARDAGPVVARQVSERVVENRLESQRLLPAFRERLLLGHGTHPPAAFFRAVAVRVLRVEPAQQRVRGVLLHPPRRLERFPRLGSREPVRAESTQHRALEQRDVRIRGREARDGGVVLVRGGVGLVRGERGVLLRGARGVVRSGRARRRREIFKRLGQLFLRRVQTQPIQRGGHPRVRRRATRVVVHLRVRTYHLPVRVQPIERLRVLRAVRERAFRPFPIEPSIRQPTRQSVLATLPFPPNPRARRASRPLPRRRLGRANRVHLLRGELIQHRVRGGEERRSARVTRVDGRETRRSRGDARGRRERRGPTRRLLGRDARGEGRWIGRRRDRRADFAEEVRDGVLGVVRHVKDLGGRGAGAGRRTAGEETSGDDAEAVEGGGAGAVGAEAAPSAESRGGGAFGGVGVGARRAAGGEGGFLAGDGDARVEDGDVPGGGGRGGGRDEGDALAELRDAAARATAAAATAAARVAAVLGRLGGARLLAAALVHRGRKG